MLMSYIFPWHSEESKQLLTLNGEPWHPKWQAEKCTVQPWEAVWHLQLTEGKKLNKFLHTSHAERFRSVFGFTRSMIAPLSYSACRPVPAAKFRRARGESQGERKSEESDFPSSVKKQSCVEYQCTSSSFFPSAFYFLSLQQQQSPLAPHAVLLSLSSSSTLLLHFSLTHPRMSPVILFILFFSPFCRSFPPIEVHTSQVSPRPYTLLPSPGGTAMVTGRADDRQGQTLLIPSSLLYRHTEPVGHSI